MVGPGKYDDLATSARESASAHGVILIVIGGNKGSGFSAQFSDEVMLPWLPSVLREVADKIEKDVNQRKDTHD